MRLSFSITALLLIAALLFGGGSNSAAVTLEVLEQPSLMIDKAADAAMLDVTRAGPRLVAVGERGIVLLSDDDGAHWYQTQTPVSTSLTAVQFVGPDTGWAVGHLGVVLHTVDGGKHWKKQLDGLGVIALQLAAAKVQAAAEPDEVEKKYILNSVQRFADDGPDKPFLNLYFLDDHTGFVFGAFNMILRTDDGGATWIPWQDRVGNPMALHLYGMEVLGNTLWLAGEQGLLLRSDDGGQHFKEVESPYIGSYFGLLADTAGNLVLYGLQGNIYRSGDGGATWEKIDTGISVSLNAGTRLSDGRLVLVSQSGDLLVSGDGGRQFQRYPASVPGIGTALVQAADAEIVIATMRGLARVSAGEL